MALEFLQTVRDAAAEPAVVDSDTTGPGLLDELNSPADRGHQVRLPTRLQIDQNAILNLCEHGLVAAYRARHVEPDVDRESAVRFLVERGASLTPIRVDKALRTGVDELNTVLLPVKCFTQRFALLVQNLFGQPRAIGRRDPDLLPLI